MRPARVAVAPRAVAPSYYVPPPVFAYRYAPSPYEITHNPMHYAAFPEAARRPSTKRRVRSRSGDQHPACDCGADEKAKARAAAKKTTFLKPHHKPHCSRQKALDGVRARQFY